MIPFGTIILRFHVKLGECFSRFSRVGKFRPAKKNHPRDLCEAWKQRILRNNGSNGTNGPLSKWIQSLVEELDKERVLQRVLQFFGLVDDIYLSRHRSESRWLATPKRWRFVRGYDKPIDGSCAIDPFQVVYLETSLNMKGKM